VPPAGLCVDELRLEPLGPEHNERDHAAWSPSVEHIRATPGFEGRNWPPDDMSLAENLADLEAHAADFAARRGFTYTVLRGETADVIGCVYVYPARDGTHDAVVRSWVRATDAELDAVLLRAMREWLERDWPFTAVEYAPR
jgi:hypothetical protein